MKPLKKTVCTLPILFGSLSLIGCDREQDVVGAMAALSQQVTETAPAASPEQQAQEWANKRWQLMVERDFAKVYQLLSEETQATISEADYVALMEASAYRWQRVEHLTTHCDADQHCRIEARLSYLYQGGLSAMQGREMSRLLDERWRNVGESWVHDL